jgi:hypothetical protein
MENWRYQIISESTALRLEQVGPLIPGAWNRHDDELGRELRGEFLIDTGAYGAMIDLDVAEALQLSLQGTREVHGIHGYGTLQQFLGRISLSALDCVGGRMLFTSVIECVGVPSLREKNIEHGVEVIGILGRMFLRCAELRIDGKNRTTYR